MKPWDISIKHPVFITMIMLALVVVGVIAYNEMPVDFFPDVSFPTMAVITVYPGAGPGEVETQVTRPIEEAMVTAPGVESVQSQSAEGYSVVIVSFDLNKDTKIALQDIREKLANVRSELPDDVLEPTISAFDPSSQPIMDISVAVKEGSPAIANIREAVTDEVLPRLQRIEGVADATVTGGREREIQVLLDADALKARRVAPQQVISTVVAESFSIPGGSVEQDGSNLLLRTPGNFQTVEDIANLQVPTAMGAVRVGDLAIVQDGFKKQDKFSRLNGQEAVIVSVRKQSGTNTVQVAERVREGLHEVEDVRPDLNLVIVQDQSDFVEESFNDAMRELLIGALMASVVVWLFFRNVRNTLVTMAGLPIIVLGTFAAMNFMGLTLNIVSLLALSLSVGLIIDDAIVVRENIFRHMEMGKTPKEASSRGHGRGRPAGGRHVADHRLRLPAHRLHRRADRAVHELLRSGRQHRRPDLAGRGDDLCAHALRLPVQATSAKIRTRRRRVRGGIHRRDGLARPRLSQSSGLDVAPSGADPDRERRHPRGQPVPRDQPQTGLHAHRGSRHGRH